MRVKTYMILQRALEEGYHLGWQRAHKYMDTPTPIQLEESILQEITNSIDEVFHFDNDELGINE